MVATFGARERIGGDLKLVKLALVLSFVIVNPTVLLLHGYHWVTQWESQAILVYTLKLSPLLYLAAALVSVGLLGIREMLTTTFAKIACFLLFLGLVAPWFFEVQPSLFYYAADFIGAATVFAYFALTAHLLKGPNGEDLRNSIFKYMVAGAAITSLVIVLIYVWSAGEKVSLPPDIHYGLALGVVLYLTSGFMSFHLQYGAYMISAGVGAAQFRMNLLIFALSIAAAWFFTIMIKKNGMFWRLVATSLLIATAVLPFSESVQKTVNRLSLVTWSPLESFSIARYAPILGSQRDALLKGQAVDQRYVEAVLVIEEMNRQPLSYLIGYGFGATFDNSSATLVGHPVREHSIHNSIFALLIRNGMLGVALFLMPAIYAGYSVFRKQDRYSFAATVGLLAIYLACMTDQYVYWGGYLGIGAAIFWGSAGRRVRTTGNHEEVDTGDVSYKSRADIQHATDSVGSASSDRIRGIR